MFVHLLDEPRVCPEVLCAICNVSHICLDLCPKRDVYVPEVWHYERRCPRDK